MLGQPHLLRLRGAAAPRADRADPDRRRAAQLRHPQRHARGRVGLGLRCWLAGLLIWLVGHAIAVWVTRKDPAFLTVLSRHARHKGALAC